jgi:hypothetical protein
LDDPGRSNAEIAIAVRVRPQTVRSVRRSLEDLGVLPVTQVARRNFPESTPLPRQPRVLMEGACVGSATPDLWTSSDAGDRNVAVQICAACHVQRECLEWALHSLPAHDQAIYGGATASQRTRMRRERGLGVPGPRGQPWINLVKINCNACGLPLSGPNLYSYTTPDGRTRRACRACRRRRTSEWQRARRAAARESQESALARCRSLTGSITVARSGAGKALTCADSARRGG